MIPVSKPSIGLLERLAVDRVLRSGNLAQGEFVQRFENEFATFIGGRECVAVNSGTSALHLALLSKGIGPGDEVIVPSFTFAATANAVELTGATAVFADVDLRTFNIDPSSIRSLITSRTKAIQPVHLYGLPAEMHQIKEIASRDDLFVFEDAAQAHLASIDGVMVGDLGDGASFSFYPTKNMTSGEGGMVVCSSSEMARKCRVLRNQGMEKKYLNELIGFNLRMTDIHAAIGLVQLRRLEKWTDRRREIAGIYNENLKGVITPFVPEGFKHVYHQYTIRVPGHNRDAFVNRMNAEGVGSGVYYPHPVHTLPSFNSKRVDLPNTELLSQEVISIPVHPQLKQKQIEKVLRVVNKLASAGA